MAKERERDFACGLNETGMRSLIADIEQELRLPKDKRFTEREKLELFDAVQWIEGAKAVRSTIIGMAVPRPDIAGTYKKGR